MTCSSLRRTGAVGSILALLVAGYGGAAQAQTVPSLHGPLGTKAVPAVEVCGLLKPSVRPASMILACGDGGTLGAQLHWTKWGAASAYATGTYTWNTCTPNCAASKTWDKATANFTLSDPVSTSAGWLFEKLVVHITGKVPKGVPTTQVLSEKPVGK